MSQIPPDYQAEVLYQPTAFNLPIQVTHLVTAHYFEYARDFSFGGESHPFWEFLYVDRGSVHVDADQERHTLTQGQLIVHAPGEWHTVICDGRVAPNLIVMSFHASGARLEGLRKQLFQMDPEGQRLLATMIAEAHRAFADDLSDYRLAQLTPRNDAAFGSEQLVKLTLEQLLIHLIRLQDQPKTAPREAAPQRPTQTQLTDRQTQLLRIQAAIEHQMYDKITLQSLAKETALSVATLSRCIKKSHDISVMAFVEQQKLNSIKRLIREGRHHIGELAQLHGYHSASHLGRIFKKHMGMTLTEYAKRLKG